MPDVKILFDAVTEKATKKIDNLKVAMNKFKGSTTEIAKAQVTASSHIEKAISASKYQWDEYRRGVEKTGEISRINTEIEKRGLTVINKELRNRLSLKAAEIKTTNKYRGVALKDYTAQEKEILRINEALTAQEKVYGKLKDKDNIVKSLFKRWRRGGLTLLSIIGPLFLVDAAMRVVQQAVDSVMKPFIEFEDALYELRKTANLTSEEMWNMGDSIVQLSKTIPLATTELAKIAAEAARLGIQGENAIMKFTKVIAMLSIATTLSAETAAESMAKIRVAFDIPIDSIENFGSALNKLENTTPATVEAIVAGMENIGASAKLLGVAEGAALAMTATLISAGMSGERAGTRLRRGFTEMANKYEEMAHQMGKDSEQWKEEIENNPTAALMEYLEFLDKLPSAVDKVSLAHKVFGQVGGFAIVTLAENYDDLVENMKTAEEEMKWGTSLFEEFSIAVGKTSAQLQILSNRAEESKRAIGDNLVPSLIVAKKISVEFWRALEDITYGLSFGSTAAIRYSDAMDVALDEQIRLNEEAEKGIGILERLSLAYEMGSRAKFAWMVSFARQDPSLIMKFFDQMIESLKGTEAQIRKNNAAQAQYSETQMWGNVILRDITESNEQFGESFISPELQKYNKFLDDHLHMKATLAELDLDAAESEAVLSYWERAGASFQAEAIRGEIERLESKKDFIELSSDEIILYEALKKLEEGQLKDLMNINNAQALVNSTQNYYNSLLDVTISRETEFGNALAKSLSAETDVRYYELEIIKNRQELVDVTDDLWETTMKLVSSTGSLYQDWIDLSNAEKTMSSEVKKIVNPYRDELKLIDDLLKAGEKEEAADLAKIVRDDLLAKGMKAKDDVKKAYYLEAIKYIDDKINLSNELYVVEDKLDTQWKDQKQSIGDLNKEYSGPDGLIVNLGKTETKANDAYKELEKIEDVPDWFKTYFGTTDVLEVVKDYHDALQWVNELPAKDINLALDLDPTNMKNTFDKLVEDIEATPIKLKFEVGFGTGGTEKNVWSKLTAPPATGYALPTNEEDLEYYLSGGGQTGIRYVPNTGIYKLHEGEEVVPAHKVKSSSIDVNINFAGNFPKQLTKSEVREIVRESISEAAKNVF